MTDVRYFIGFNRVSGIGPAKLQKLLDFFGDLETAWTAGSFELATAGLDKRALENLLVARKEMNLDAETEKAYKVCDTILTWDDDAYPRRLKEIPLPPPFCTSKARSRLKTIGRSASSARATQPRTAKKLRAHSAPNSRKIK